MKKEKIKKVINKEKQKEDYKTITLEELHEYFQLFNKPKDKPKKNYKLY